MREENRENAFEPVMRDLQARYEQMKNLERVTQNEKIRLTRKIPEIEKNLEALNVRREPYSSSRGGGGKDDDYNEIKVSVRRGVDLRQS